MTQVTRIHVSQEEIERRRRLVADCHRLTNARPLAHLFADPPFYCRLAGVDLQQTYVDPDAMIHSQILGWKAILEAVDCDVPGVNVDLVFGSFLTASIYGCEVVRQDGSIPGFHPWVTCESDLEKLERFDPWTAGYGPVYLEQYRRFQELAEQYPVQYDGGEVEYPLCKVRLGTWTEGPFTIACMIAGLDRISLWCYDQPEIVHALLQLITAMEIKRIRSAFEIMGETPGPVGMADDYSPYLSRDMYEQFILPYQQQVRDAFGKTVEFHSCIPDRKLVEHWRDQLRITVFNGFKPQRGLESLAEDYAPVAEAMANRIVLEPDLDGANVMIATEADLRQAVQTVYELFAPGRGLKIAATLAGGHRADDLEKMNAIKRTIREMSQSGCFELQMDTVSRECSG